MPHCHYQKLCLHSFLSRISPVLIVVLCELIFSSVLGLYATSPVGLPSGYQERLKIFFGTSILFVGELCSGRISWRINLLRLRNQQTSSAVKTPEVNNDDSFGIVPSQRDPGSDAQTANVDKSLSRTSIAMMKRLSEKEEEDLRSTKIDWSASLFIRFLLFGAEVERTLGAVQFSSAWSRFVRDHMRKRGRLIVLRLGKVRLGTSVKDLDIGFYNCMKTLSIKPLNLQAPPKNTRFVLPRCFLSVDSGCVSSVQYSD